MRSTVAIVGGGFSGLASAFLLERGLREPPRTIVLEASERFGGRICTGALGAAAVPYDAGAAELYDITGNPQLRHLVEMLGLPTRPLRATPTFFFEGRRLESDDDFREAFGAEAMKRFGAFWEAGTRARPSDAYAAAGHPADNDHPWSNRSFRDVLRSIGDPDVERFTAVQVHSDLATAPERTNGVYGFDNLLIDDPRYCSMYTIVGGNERLVTRLVEEVDAELRLGAPTVSITPRRDGRYAVVAGERDVLTVDAVLLTPPPPYLLEIDYHDPTLRAAIERHVRHHDHPASYLRVTVLFERRFWSDDLPDDYWVSDAFDGVTVYDQSPGRAGGGGPGVLSWLIAGAPAERLARRPDAEVARDVLASLPPELEHGADRVVDSRVDAWIGRTGVSALPGGRPLLPLRQRHQPSAAHPRVTVVGDYLYDATISGALDGCSQGLELLLGALGGPETPTAAQILERAGLSGVEGPESRQRESQLPFLRSSTRARR